MDRDDSCAFSSKPAGVPVCYILNLILYFYNMTRRLISLIFSAVAVITMAAVPEYPFNNCCGSLIPYPDRETLAQWPDTLKPVFINHVGRHGARYPASSTHTLTLLDMLREAESLGSLTPTGRKLLKITEDVARLSKGRWGALDSLGMAEQAGIADRMYRSFPAVFKAGAVSALSSDSPRCMMSMFSFVHQLDKRCTGTEIVTLTGAVTSPLMRPFDVDSAYLDFRHRNLWKPAYDKYMERTVPLTALHRVVGDKFPFRDEAHARDMALMEYYVLAGLSAMSYQADLSEFFTLDEINRLWSCFNLRQYLQRTATSVSTVPADIARPLVRNLVETTDRYVNGDTAITACLRFGHAETLMPLLSLLRIPGCYYVTDDFSTVSANWRDFYVVPLASNIRFTLFKAPSGEYYLRTDLNEEPVTLIPGDPRLYLPWSEARQYMLSL